MRVVVQRVSEASVAIDGKINGKIQLGLLILLGIEASDGTEDLEWLIAKITRLRIFADDAGKMNLSLLDMDGEALVVSQFTLHASTKKGNRPSFIKAAHPDLAIPLYEAFVNRLSLEMKKPVATGVFGADMKVQLINDGPVTIAMDSKNRE